MAGNSNTDESVTGPVADPVLSDNQAAETTNDIVDVLQKSTATVSKIYSVLFSKSKAEFMQDLSENNNAAELRYVRDMMFVIMKRRKPSTQYGNLVERRATENIKDTLLKDIYSIFCYGEGSTNSLPKNLFKADRFLSSSGTQTGLCIDSPTATLADLNVLKTQLLQKVAELRNDFLNVSTSQCVSPTVVGNVVDLRPINSEQTGLAEVFRTRPMNPPTIDLSYVEDHEAVKRTKSRKILVASDSLLHRMNQSKMNVGNIESIKLTERGDNLEGTFHRTRNFVSRRAKTDFDIVVLAGTNDLSKRSVSPQSLIDKLKELIDDIKSFNNVQRIFICKIPPRSDHHRINSKVSHYNSLLVETLSNVDNVTIVETIPLESRLFYVDNLHLSKLGLRHVSGIILSSLYRVLAPDLYRPKAKKSYSVSDLN